MDEKILTNHPQGKRGANMSRQKYDLVRAAITGCLRGGNEPTHNELAACVRQALDARSEGSIDWYTECVKLDLEASRLIERTATKPQPYRLIG